MKTHYRHITINQWTWKIRKV